MDTPTTTVTKHQELSALSLRLKNSINELLREIDIAHNGGIDMPEVCMLTADDAYKLMLITEALADIDNVVGEPNLPCPVESQNVVTKCRTIASSTDKIDPKTMDYIK